MRVVDDAWHHGALSAGAVATIGNFDGIHRGQRAVLEKVRDRSTALGLEAVVVTFEPHPRGVLEPDSAPPQLTTIAQKRALLEQEGIDLLVVVNFDESFARTGAEEFARRLLNNSLSVRELFVGSSFGFGRGRKGNLDLLRSLGRELGFVVSGIAELEFDGEPVSSTRIRRAIREGEMTIASALLGRAYSITGQVEHGLGRGRRLGWPTINVCPENDLLPRSGVYVTTAVVPGVERRIGGVTNVGIRPTFPDDFSAGSRRFVECHLLDFEAEIYDDTVELSFHEKLRDERAFPSPEELSRQIGEDVKRAREYLMDKNCFEGQPSG